MKLSPRWLMIPGIVIGVVAVVLALKFQDAPSVMVSEQSAHLVDVLHLSKVESAPQVSGYGLVKPKFVWEALSEVSGSIIYKHAELEQGAILEAGTLLLKIDPLEYQLLLVQAKASLAMSETQLQRSLQEKQNLHYSLDIETQRLALADDELERKQSLYAKQLISSSELEAEKQNTLAQRKVLQDLNNQLSLWPADHALKQAQVDVDKSKLADAERRLAKTEIYLPFDAKIAELNVELEQVVSQGTTMLIADRFDVVEVELQVSQQDMRRLIRNLESDALDNGKLPKVDQLKLKAQVQLASGGSKKQWQAQITRFSDTIKPEQGTIGIYLEVEQDWRKHTSEQILPLVKGMYVKGQLSGQMASVFIVPERALHQQNIYLIDEQQKLKIIPVKELYRNTQGVAISANIEAGNRLILNDLIPAVEGMALRVVEADK